MTAWKVENWTAAPPGLVKAKNIQLTVVYKRNTIWVMNLPCFQPQKRIFVWDRGPKNNLLCTLCIRVLHFRESKKNLGLKQDYILFQDKFQNPDLFFRGKSDLWNFQKICNPRNWVLGLYTSENRIQEKHFWIKITFTSGYTPTSGFRLCDRWKFREIDNPRNWALLLAS
jgi:hypothetical protein